ncbi:hypothetical protein LTR78_004578 [Recurvomyces mirabilis]|uniref:Borealin N-terminal domain-containing protein n=1 Tax=Recurvomyces mirabilis TaxID=574656 RepID=A0AAE0WPB3_9PEZI|nr:hypothetical protein LTR78_004578 [Recurvomyces mirabilis]KAK5152928.1 hypothetical protein LTS14_008036 [Recurvomyces mirabilis]
MPPRVKKMRQSVEAPVATISQTEHEQHEEAHTPEQSPGRRTASITAAQKQALIDNLQLEITERARKLRAQYALQAQGLRARLEMRVNRIPTALRKRNMQDLLDEHAEKARPAPAPPVPAKDTPREVRGMPVAPVSGRGMKRMSDQIARNEGDDKENAPTSELDHELPNPKKRAKTNTANTKATRTVSRKAVPANVLSPRSHNSRTLPKSPFKAVVTSPFKSHMSPVKPVYLGVPPSAASSRAPSRQQTKRPATVMSSDVEGRSSEASNTSAGTTIIHKAAAKGRAVVKKPVAVAKSAVASATGGKKGGRKAVAEVPVAATSSGRTLRRRG